MNLVLHLRKYPTIRLPCGYQVTFKTVESTNLEPCFAQYIFVETVSHYVSFQYDDADQGWCGLRYMRKLLANQFKKGEVPDGV